MARKYRARVCYSLYVADSLPADGRETILRARPYLPRRCVVRAVSSVVERLVYTEDVGSSTLSPPTIVFNTLAAFTVDAERVDATFRAAKGP